MGPLILKLYKNILCIGWIVYHTILSPLFLNILRLYIKLI